jgi:hypothetical protein
MRWEAWCSGIKNTKFFSLFRCWPVWAMMGNGSLFLHGRHGRFGGKHAQFEFKVDNPFHCYLDEFCSRPRGGTCTNYK